MPRISVLGNIPPLLNTPSWHRAKLSTETNLPSYLYHSNGILQHFAALFLNDIKHPKG